MSPESTRNFEHEEDDQEITADQILQSKMREILVTVMEQRGIIKSPEVASAMREVDRASFCDPTLRAYAYLDRPLPILGDQAISQPSVVANMLERAKVPQGGRVLDVGMGSGYQTAILSHLVGEAGQVHALEINPKVYNWGCATLAKCDLENVFTRCADGSLGLPEAAPYDAIICAASSDRGVPSLLFGQLKVGGRLVIPINKGIKDGGLPDDYMTTIVRTSDGFNLDEEAGYNFVKLQ